MELEQSGTGTSLGISQIPAGSGSALSLSLKTAFSGLVSWWTELRRTIYPERPLCLRAAQALTALLFHSHVPPQLSHNTSMTTELHYN